MSRSKIPAQVAWGALVLLGALALAGWGFDIPALKNPWIGPAAMKANTALCFLFVGLSLAFFNAAKFPGRLLLRQLAFVCALAVLLLALLTVLEYAFGWNAGIDQMLFRDTTPVAGGSYPGRMGPNTALCFLLTAAALVLISRFHPARAARPFALGLLGALVAVIGLVAILGYITGIGVGYRWGNLTGMSFPSAMGFVLIAVGILLLAWKQSGLRWTLQKSITLSFPIAVFFLAVIGLSSWQTTRQATLVNELRPVSIQFSPEEEQLLFQRQQAAKAAAERTLFVLGVSSVLGVGSVATAIFFLNENITDRKRGEEALQRSERLLRVVTSNARVGLVIVDSNYEYLFANEAYSEVLGLPMKNIVGRRVPDVLGSVWRQIQPQLDRALAGKRTAYELTLPPGTGGHPSARWFDVLCEPRVSETGERTVVVVVGDITARKHAEQALRDSEGRFRSLAENIAHLAWMADGEGSIFWYNQRWYDYSGTSFEEMRGWGWERVHHPDHLQRILASWRAALASGHRWEDVFPLRSRNGQYRWFLSRAFPIRDESGKITRWFGTNTDVTELRDAQQALAEREAVLRTVTSEARVGLVMVDQNLTFLFANHTYAEILGLPDANLVGRRVPDVLPEIYEMVKGRLARGLAGERLTDELRLPARSGSSEERIYEVIYQPRTGEAGHYIIVVIVDVTQRKKAQEILERTVAERTAQLREANENLQTFTYTAAHDLRAPLRSIHGFSVMLRDNYGSRLDSACQNLLVRIERSTTQMDHLLTDLLEYSKISQAQLSLEPVRVRDTIRAALSLLESDIRAKDAAITVADSQFSVLAHPATLTLLLQNLISNALKFTSEGTRPQIRISVEATTEASQPSNAPFIRLCVQDNGIGIAPAEVGNLFNVFHRLHSTTAYQGTGLGLAMVRKGAERMGGRVGVESEPGKGSTFCLDLRPATEA